MGQNAPIQYLEKGGREYVVVFSDEAELVNLVVIVSICAFFEIDSKAVFGVSLP
jgi:hypothetical protein